MKKKFVNKLLRFLASFVPHFPIILNTQTDIFQAEHSGDLSFGMLEDPNQPKLLPRIRYLVSMLYEHRDHDGHQNLFFNFTEKTSWPFSPDRLAARQDTWEKLKKVFTQYESMDEHSSALFRYMIQPSEKYDLEREVRIELISFVVHQWNDKLQIDTQFIEALDTFSEARDHPLKTLFFPNKPALEKAKQCMELHVEGSPLLYHHSWGIGITLWNGIKKLHAEIHKPEFIQVLTSGNWSPAAFLTQHKIAPKQEFRVTARKTNLDGLLSRTIDPGRLVILNSRDAAEDAKGLFMGVCCGADFVMDMLTLLVDRVHPGVRNMQINGSCPYSKKISRPLY